MCLSNQRQIYTGAVVYTGDYNGWVPVGTDCVMGNTQLPTIGPYNTVVWFQNYLKMSSSGNDFTNPNGIGWCPSSQRRMIWPNAWFLRWTRSLDYALPGLMNIGMAPSTIARVNEHWGRWSQQYGPRIFSMDLANLTAPVGGGLDANIYTPHWNKQANAPAGANVITTDGSGRWVPISQCTTNGGTIQAGGWWSTMGTYWTHFMMPTGYEMSYDGNWCARQGYERNAAGDPGGNAFGLQGWP